MGANYSNEVFKPPEEPTYTPEALNIQWIGDTTKKVPVVIYEWIGRNKEKAHFTLLYSGGNSEDLGQTRTWLLLLRDALHVDVVAYEYTGYGVSRSGKPSEKNCYEDIKIVYGWLLGERSIPSNRIILMGKTIGSGPVLHLAHQLYQNQNNVTKWGGTLSKGFSRKTKRILNNEVVTFHGLAGIILNTPIASVLSFNLQTSRTTALLPDMFENIKKTSKIECPIFLFHGGKDELVPLAHSKKLHSLLAKHVWKFIVIPEAYHLNIETEFTEDILEELYEFISFISPQDLISQRERNSSLIPDAFTSAPSQVINKWLQGLNLTEYCDKFLTQGYFDMQIISQIDETDLDIIGISNSEHRNIILSEIRSLKQLNHSSNSTNLEQAVELRKRSKQKLSYRFVMTEDESQKSSSQQERTFSEIPNLASSIGQNFTDEDKKESLDEELNKDSFHSEESFSEKVPSSLKKSNTANHSAISNSYNQLPPSEHERHSYHHKHSHRSSTHMLEKRVKELEATVAQQNQAITDLSHTLQSAINTIKVQQLNITSLHRTMEQISSKMGIPPYLFSTTTSRKSMKQAKLSASNSETDFTQENKS